MDFKLLPITFLFLCGAVYLSLPVSPTLRLKQGSREEQQMFGVGIVNDVLFVCSFLCAKVEIFGWRIGNWRTWSGWPKHLAFIVALLTSGKSQQYIQRYNWNSLHTFFKMQDIWGIQQKNPGPLVFCYLSGNATWSRFSGQMSHREFWMIFWV